MLIVFPIVSFLNTCLLPVRLTFIFVKICLTIRSSPYLFLLSTSSCRYKKCCLRTGRCTQAHSNVRYTCALPSDVVTYPVSVTPYYAHFNDASFLNN